MSSSRLFCSGVPVSRSLLLACSNTITGLCESLGQGLSMTVQRLTVQLTQVLQAQRHHHNQSLVLQVCTCDHPLHIFTNSPQHQTHFKYVHTRSILPALHRSTVYCVCEHTCIFMRCVYRSEFMFLSMCPSSSTRQSRESFLKNFLSSA